MPPKKNSNNKSSKNTKFSYPLQPGLNDNEHQDDNTKDHLQDGAPPPQATTNNKNKNNNNNENLLGEDSASKTGQDENQGKEEQQLLTTLDPSSLNTTHKKKTNIKNNNNKNDNTKQDEKQEQDPHSPCSALMNPNNKTTHFHQTNSSSYKNGNNNHRPRVYVRIGPLTESGRSVFSSKEEHPGVLVMEKQSRNGKPEHQNVQGFDRVFDQDTTQEQVYNAISPELLSTLSSRCNATVFCYGQTGSGKTFTMEGSKNGSNFDKPHPERGLIPRAIESIFHEFKSNSKITNPSFELSMLQIYNEQVQDLFQGCCQLDIILDKNTSQFIARDAHWHTVTNSSKALNLFYQGTAQRATNATKMNLMSSRSHIIFMLRLQWDEPKLPGCRAQLNLVDLAGSEKLKQSGATGGVMKEAIVINKSLSALGNVVRALVDHLAIVPYRESKLTQLLQSSLSGSSSIHVILTISASSRWQSESTSTVEFGKRALRLVVHPVENRIEDKRLEEMKAQKLLDAKEQAAQCEQANKSNKTLHDDVPRTDSNSIMNERQDDHPRVYARIRPLSDDERTQSGHRPVFSSKEEHSDVLLVEKETEDGKIIRKVPFNRVFDQDTTQEQVYNAISPELLSTLSSRCNATVFCYGQTGSGKTFTMEGSKNGSNFDKPHPERGLIPRAIESIFHKFKSNSEITNPSFELSMLQIYNEQVQDLFQEDERRVLEVRYDTKNYEYVAKDAIWKKCLNPSDMFTSFYDCTTNKVSSHCHIIVMLRLQWDEPMLPGCRAQLNLVNLAGSESLTQFGATAADKEHSAINKSLVTLRNVVTAIVEDKDYVPYHDSQLTQLLKSSLYGSNMVQFIITLEASRRNIFQSNESIKFGESVLNLPLQVLKNPIDIKRLEEMKKNIVPDPSSHDQQQFQQRLHQKYNNSGSTNVSNNDRNAMMLHNQHHQQGSTITNENKVSGARRGRDESSQGGSDHPGRNNDDDDDDDSPQ